MANNIKVRVGQTPAVKVLTSGTISAVPSFSALTDTSFSNLTDGQFAAYELHLDFGRIPLLLSLTSMGVFTDVTD